MKKQPFNDIFSSFVLWFDHTLLRQGEAFDNVNTRFYPVKDDKLKNYSVYGSPYKQFVYDSSISGAQVPSGIYSNGVFIPRGQSGLKIDFTNGRVIFSGGVNIPVSGQFSPKNFNVYATNQSDQELVFEQRINFASQFPQSPSGIPSDKVIAPGVFIRFGDLSSELFAFGGTYDNKINARAIILSDTDYALSAIGNIFVDQKENNFLAFSKTPLNEWGDLKTGHYSYHDYLDQYYDSSNLAYIEDVDFTKLKVINPQNPDIRIGFLDFNISLPRVPMG